MELESEVNGNHHRPLYISVEMAENLIYLARLSLGNLEELRKYLERAADIVQEGRDDLEVE